MQYYNYLNEVNKVNIVEYLQEAASHYDKNSIFAKINFDTHHLEDFTFAQVQELLEIHLNFQEADSDKFNRRVEEIVLDRFTELKGNRKFADQDQFMEFLDRQYDAINLCNTKVDFNVNQVKADPIKPKLNARRLESIYISSSYDSEPQQQQQQKGNLHAQQPLKKVKPNQKPFNQDVESDDEQMKQHLYQHNFFELPFAFGYKQPQINIQKNNNFALNIGQDDHSKCNEKIQELKFKNQECIKECVELTLELEQAKKETQRLRNENLYLNTRVENFIQEIRVTRENFTCPVCLDIKIQANHNLDMVVLGNCGHWVCMDCNLDLVTSSKIFTQTCCPVCRLNVQTRTQVVISMDLKKLDV